MTLLILLAGTTVASSKGYATASDAGAMGSTASDAPARASTASDAPANGARSSNA